MKDFELEEFFSYVGDLLELTELKNLDLFSQHLNASRLSHSINVAYYSFLACKRLKLDYVSAARAGLLHDLYFYDWRFEKQEEGRHAFAHPIVALRNAQKLAELNNIERDAIVKHMWPVTLRLPRYRESYVVSMADKYCAMAEIYSGLKAIFKRLIFAQ